MTKKRNKRYPVWFNFGEYKLFKSLNLSEPFSDFVSGAFYDKIDSLRSSAIGRQPASVARAALDVKEIDKEVVNNE